MHLQPKKNRQPLILSAGVRSDGLSHRSKRQSFLCECLLNSPHNPFHKILTDCKLVIAGKGGGPYYEKMKNYIREHGAEDAIVFTRFITDHQLSFLLAT